MREIKVGDYVEILHQNKNISLHKVWEVDKKRGAFELIGKGINYRLYEEEGMTYSIARGYPMYYTTLITGMSSTEWRKVNKLSLLMKWGLDEKMD